MNNGFITLHRQILSWQWYQDVNTFKVFIHCLLKANHTKTTWQLIEIDRGQFITSLKSLSAETGLSERQIRTSLNKLIKTNELTSKATNKYRTITVLKYNEYQTVDKQKVKPPTIKRQASDKPPTTDNNDNNEETFNNDNNLKDIVPYQTIIDFLNLKTNKNFRNVETHKKLIKARFNNGYTLEDFKKVITNKCNDWLNTDSDMYLQPSTLFGNKFDGYLNQKSTKSKEDTYNDKDSLDEALGLGKYEKRG